MEAPAVIDKVVPVVELAGWNVAVTPAGNPVIPKVTVPVNPVPGITVIGTVVPVPRASVKVSPGAEMLKFGAPAAMTRVPLADAVSPPDVPLKITE